MADVTVKIAGIELKNPIITASGTFGFGEEYKEYFDLSELGGMSMKGLTPKRREGNPPPRIAETPMGILNSVGLQNPGIDAFLSDELPRLEGADTVLIANFAGNTMEEYEGMAEKLSDSSVHMLEMNISCPNVKEGGVAFGTNANMVEELTRRVKAKCQKPLIVKLTPNVTDVTEIARAAEAGGADCLSLINTLLGMKIDLKTRRPILKNVMGGLSGPAVKPVAVRMVYQVSRAVKLPIIGMGGIMTGADAVEFALAGACAVGVGTALFLDPTAPVRIKREIEEYLEQNGIKTWAELVGQVEV